MSGYYAIAIGGLGAYAYFRFKGKDKPEAELEHIHSNLQQSEEVKQHFKGKH